MNRERNVDMRYLLQHIQISICIKILALVIINGTLLLQSEKIIRSSKFFKRKILCVINLKFCNRNKWNLIYCITLLVAPSLIIFDTCAWNTIFKTSISSSHSPKFWPKWSNWTVFHFFCIVWPTDSIFLLCAHDT